ncbi:MAG: UDP-N-acetylmuramate--L-alanine ligase, partial [Acidimicrobiales bacterium]
PPARARPVTARSEAPFDLARPRRLHIVGVTGTGMSAYASVLAQAGHRVTGSDATPDPAVATRLRDLGVLVHAGHDAAHVPPDVEAVAASTAVPADNPELAAARRRPVPVLRRADLLAALCRLRRTLAVAGTHGKTTTSALLAVALRGAGRHPSFVVGADVPSLDHGAHWDDGDDLLVAEADESDGTFLELPRHLALVTSVEADHLATYGGTIEGLQAAFRRFVVETPGPVVLGIDDLGAAALLADRPDAATFGTAESASFRLTGLAVERLASRFTLRYAGGTATVELPTPGLHNARNAAGALAAGIVLGADPERAAAALATYGGVHRRFEPRGEAGGVTYVDDYAHLPGEVRAVLGAARRGGWPRVVAVFQPHRFSRTAEVHAQFASAFAHADVLVVTGIYPAGEEPRPGVTGRLIADASGHRALTYVEHRADVAAAVRALLQPGDLCLTMGAGDITGLADELRA